MKKVIVQLFERKVYKGAATVQTYAMQDRAKTAALLGAADSVAIHGRLHNRGGAATVDFSIAHGCLGRELPLEGARKFMLTPGALTPTTLPWTTTNMPDVPDDGTFIVTPVMGLADVAMEVGGGSGTWAELEVWATLIFET